VAEVEAAVHVQFVLAGSRFRVSALAETVATLGVVAEQRAQRPGQLARRRSSGQRSEPAWPTIRSAARS
jgi:hypothetical protein